MSIDECSIQQLVAQLRITHFQSYLLNHGWVETPSRYADQLRYEGNMNDGEGVYEMYLPVSSDIAKYRTRLLRNIYKLCGIEDREPREIAREMVVRHEAVESREATRDVARLARAQCRIEAATCTNRFADTRAHVVRTRSYRADVSRRNVRNSGNRTV